VSKAGFWRRDWFLGLAVAVGLFFVGGSDPIQSLERKAYDMGVRVTDRAPSDRIAVIAIDEASLRNIGRWPWSRDVHARMSESLATGKAKVVGSLVFFTEPQLVPGLAYINKISGEYRKLAPDPAAVEQGTPLAQMGTLLQEAEGALSGSRPARRSHGRSGRAAAQAERGDEPSTSLSRP
jgi:serine/threonine-protein kinase